MVYKIKMYVMNDHPKVEANINYFVFVDSFGSVNRFWFTFIRFYYIFFIKLKLNSCGGGDRKN